MYVTMLSSATDHHAVQVPLPLPIALWDILASTFINEIYKVALKNYIHEHETNLNQISV